MSAQPPAAPNPVQKFLQSKTTQFLLGTLAVYVLIALGPMLAAHSIDWWKLGEVIVVNGGALLLNALRKDVDAGSLLNRLNGPKDVQP